MHKFVVQMTELKKITKCQECRTALQITNGSYEELHSDKFEMKKQLKKDLKFEGSYRLNIGNRNFLTVGWHDIVDEQFKQVMEK